MKKKKLSESGVVLVVIRNFECILWKYFSLFDAVFENKKERMGLNENLCFRITESWDGLGWKGPLSPGQPSLFSRIKCQKLILNASTFFFF